MAAKIRSLAVGAPLRLVDATEVAADATERDLQQLAVARRLVEQPELGISSVTVCGLLDIYVVESSPNPVEWSCCVWRHRSTKVGCLSASPT